jgi:hypothetical protein
MNRIVLKNIFIKVQIYHFLINIFFIINKSKLCFKDRCTVKNCLVIQIWREYVH